MQQILFALLRPVLVQAQKLALKLQSLQVPLNARRGRSIRRRGGKDLGFGGGKLRVGESAAAPQRFQTFQFIGQFYRFYDTPGPRLAALLNHCH